MAGGEISQREEQKGQSQGESQEESVEERAAESQEASDCTICMNGFPDLVGHLRLAT
ncbi:MAG: hypothetical protein ACMG6E_06815 [Candidatus Roizmanbacteria bacterium]